jgi:hypothetical protein
MAKVLRSRAFLPIVLVAIASGIGQVAGLLDLVAVPTFFGAAAQVCARASGPSGAGTARYYRCLLKSAWLRNPTMLRLGLDGLGTPWGVIVVTAFAGAIALLFYAARRAASDSESALPLEPSAEPDDRVDDRETVVVAETEAAPGDYEPARTRSRSSSLATLPVAFNGSSFTISNVRGTL